MIPLSQVLNERGTPNPEWIRYLNLVQPQPVVAISSAGVFIPSGLAGPLFTIVLTENTAFANPDPVNTKPGTELIIEMIQDATGGRAITLGSQYKFPTNLPAPTWNTTANAVNLLKAYWDGTILLCQGYAGFA